MIWLRAYTPTPRPSALSKDGIYLPSTPRDITIGYMGPGNRADWLVRCPAGSYELFSNQIRRRKLQGGKGKGGGVGLVGGGVGNAAMTQLLATVVATEGGDTQCDLPTFAVNRPVRKRLAPTCTPPPHHISSCSHFKFYISITLSPSPFTDSHHLPPPPLHSRPPAL